MTFRRGVVAAGLGALLLVGCGKTIDLHTVAGAPSAGAPGSGEAIDQTNGGEPAIVGGGPTTAGGAGPTEPPPSCLAKPDCPWSEGRAMLLHSRGQAAAAYQESIYLIGGESVERDFLPLPQDDPTFQQHASVFQYVPAGQRWTEKAPLLAGMFSLTAHAIGDKLYTFGGYGMNGFDNRTQVYDTAANAWSEGEPMPTTRYIFTSELVDGKVYVLGGQGPTQDSMTWDYLKSVEVFDPTSGWSTVSSMRYSVGGHASCVLDGHIYVFGGEAGNRTQVYDIANDIWSVAQPPPVARNGHTCITVAGQLILLGGRNLESLDLVERYDPETDSWQTLDPMPHARYWFAAAAIDDEIYVFGGMGPQAALLSDVDVLDMSQVH
jgi:N-acetylneuraminic acid mutarotase